MPRSAQNGIRILHPEQEISQRPSWERLPGESPLWFQRFTRYRLIGRNRSLQAVVAQEREDEQAQEGHKITKTERVFPLDSLPKPPGARDEEERRAAPLKEVKSIPGSWKRASVQWRWVERAEAWDLAQFAQWQQKLAKDVYFECEFASKQYRLWALNACCDFLSRIVLQSFDSDPHVTARDKMAAIKLSQDLMRDIRREMTRLEDPFSRR